MNILRFIIPKSSVEYITKGSTVRQALEKMRYHRYVAIPVLDDEGIYLGTLRSDDIFRYFLDNKTFDKRSAEEDPVESILDLSYSRPMPHDAPVSELFERVKEHNFVAVTDGAHTRKKSFFHTRQKYDGKFQALRRVHRQHFYGVISPVFAVLNRVIQIAQTRKKSVYA